MKNKLLVVLFMGFLVLSLAGCGKKDATKKIEVTGPRVVCKHSDELDGVKTDIIITLKFNSDNYVNYQLMESTVSFIDKEAFNSYADATIESAKTMELGSGVEYDYSIDKAKKQITSYMIYNENVFDYSNISDEEKANLQAATLIKTTEDSGATCEFIETTRELLGL